jgi:outer membrane usher protein FimD/PapC
MALHSAGLTLSPYPLQDTFALLEVGAVPNVKVDTPGGPVWTDRTGMAVIPQLAPYGRSAVEVVTQSLPRNVDIQQGAAQLRAGRGAVPRLQFAAITTRRALLRSVNTAGEPLPSGALVLGADGALVTLVQEGGMVFIADVLQTPSLRVRLSEHSECELDFVLPDQADTEAYFDTAPAVCRAS